MEQGPNYSKRLLDPSKLTLGALVRRYWKDSDGTWRHEDIEITRERPFTSEGSLWTAGRRVGGSRQDYISLSDMGIVPRRNNTYNSRSYTVVLEPGRPQ